MAKVNWDRNHPHAYTVSVHKAPDASVFILDEAYPPVLRDRLRPFKINIM